MSGVGSPRTARINALWVIDHVCYDGSLHGGGRLYWNVLQHFEESRIRVVPCLLRATAEIRRVFRDSPVPVRILDKGKFDPSTLWTFLHLIKEEAIDVMHLHCYGASTFGRVASALTGVPAVIQDYDTEVYFPYPWYLWLADLALAPVTDRAIAPSPMVRDFLVRKRKIDGARITGMVHAIPADRYQPVAAARVAAIRDTLGVAPGVRLVGTVTKLGPQRGNDVLLEAAAQVVRRVPNCCFVLLYQPTPFHRLPSRKYVEVSTTDAEASVAELARQIERLGLGSFVRLVERPAHVGDYVAACDFVVAPFLSERFSSVPLLEAMAQGKAVVATALGEQGEIVQDGVNGLLVRPGQVDELAASIAHLLEDPVALRRLGRRAREDAEGYGAPAYARALEGMYAELVDRTPARRRGAMIHAVPS
jgi:glycosyltransferase involved in cell wall biosynthesis